MCVCWRKNQIEIEKEKITKKNSRKSNETSRCVSMRRQPYFRTLPSFIAAPRTAAAAAKAKREGTRLLTSEILLKWPLCCMHLSFVFGAVLSTLLITKGPWRPDLNDAEKMTPASEIQIMWRRCV